ncbi:MAG TPA: HNH endonuclease [Thermoanaerobaculia bacterium]
MKALFDALFFPGSRQERSPDPGPFLKYRSYKPYLQREFRRKCVYCRISDGLKGDEGFGVDHYLPKSRFPDLVTAWRNLFYACNVCNTWKGESVSTPDRFLPNPCEHRMSDHLQYSGAGVETYTPHGEWLTELLRLGERRGFREFILSALGKFLKTRNNLMDDLTHYETRLDAAQSSEERSLLQAAIQDTAEELEQVDRHIERLTGEPVTARRGAAR